MTTLVTIRQFYTHNVGILPMKFIYLRLVLKGNKNAISKPLKPRHNFLHQNSNSKHN